MSSLTHAVKTRMAGFLQNLLRKLVDPSAATPPAPASNPAVAGASGSAAAQAHKVTPLHKNGGQNNGRGIELPLQPILAALPLELQPRLKHPDAGALTLCIPLEKILAQLSSGVVKISFGELRQAAPDLFTPETDRDRVLVPLPLVEILTRLNPALIIRRREQKLVEVPADIRSPFDQHGQGLVFSVGPAQPEAAPAPLLKLAPPSRASISFAPTPPPPAAPPLSAPAMSSASRGLRDQKPAALRQPPRPRFLSPAKPAPNPEPLVVSLPSLAEGWPEAVRKEIVQLNLVDAKVALPGEVVERALKQGRIAFTWKTLRSWIKPAPLPAVSAHDSTVLELPLKLVAPLFLARQHEAEQGAKEGRR